jgi:phage shock protein A
MAKKIERLKRITKARIEAFLDTLERPEVIFPQLIKELSAMLKEAVNSEAKSLSAVKADQRRLDEANGAVLRFEKGAALAVNSSDIETAKHAISAQINAEQNVDRCTKALERSESAYAAARQARVQLQENTKDLKARQSEIIKRSRQAQLQKEILQTQTARDNPSTESIMDAIARIEQKVELQESEIEIRNEISRTLGSAFNAEQITKLDNESEIQRRLDKLKSAHRN